MAGGRRSAWLVGAALVASVLVAPGGPAGARDDRPGEQPADVVDVQSDVPFVGLQGPSRVAFGPQGELYVVDTVDMQVLKLPGGGAPQEVLPFTGLAYPYGVTVDSEGSVFVTSSVDDKVYKLPAGGGPQVVVPFIGLSTPTSLAVDSADNIYVTDLDNDAIMRISSDFTDGPYQVGFEGLDRPSGVAIDQAGNVYVADVFNGRVVKEPAGGGAQVTLPFTGLSRPRSVAVDAAGNVYVTESTTDSVYMLPAGGGPQVTVPFTGLDNPGGIMVDGAGSLYVSDSNHDRVVLLSRASSPLRVTTSPAVPATISVDGIARDSWGLNWSPFPVGAHRVCFGPVPGFTAPACQDVTLTPGVTTVVQGTYAPRGYLRVITEPAVPSTITVDGVARNDWGMWSEIAPGTHSVCFGAVEGFDGPACRDVVVAAGATATTTGTFTTNPAAPGPAAGYGLLRAITSPAVNAMITVDGQPRDAWGLVWLKVPAGSHEVCFGPAPDTTAPAACQTASVTAGNATGVVGTYVPHGFLRVLTSPAVPAAISVNGQTANAWGVWTGKAPGSYSVCFGAVPGYTAPPCQTATVTGGSTATITGTYAPA